MSEGRPSLKLTFGKKKAPEEPPKKPAPPPPSETPQRKLTLKIARKPTTEAEPEKAKKKKPSKKRPADEPAASEPSASRPAPEKPAGPKRLKLNPSKKPGVQSIRIKNKGLVPNRPVGVGYDSEASDTEIDPSIEEGFILRMLPGEECEYLRRAIAERRFDRSEFSFKPLTREGRRAVFRVRDKQFAAALVDLPCIIEGMKSWDRRGWYKSGDICQMLLVLGPVANEKEALEYPLPPEVEHGDDKTLQYPHGLTPPLQWVRRRRFRERVSTRTIEQVEKAVEDLIAQDEAAFGVPRYELVDSASLNRAEGLVQSGEYDEYDDEQDAEGEWDMGMEEAPGIFEDFEDALAAEMEAALAADDNAAPPAAAATPVDSGVYQAGTPMATKPSTPAAESSGDESDESDGDERGVPEDGLDEEQLEQRQQMQQQREEIAELEALIRTETAKWEKMQNQILKNKLARRIQELKKDLSLKKVSIGEGDEDA
ncbi:TAFII55 protein conserved region-domain-containing protein [Aspergillus pseudonomiae]|uniref:TAFII55 protein conserved region-domain-containing protein n=1 Tax=Aspergillus pseudonomiae TaxID=1506151 RepID=A0A5N6IJP4_9EURO|nr:TAFII55 protein conserved region-domain-containing protein [Aspergillus pseudonomiae]KAB8265353.1 TAFII55 protein conserved region-domain-containing protein [Aspergillus pseudonomiae]KAE8402445.1 TAFII55 protein conserved region-domain-containing protein [Aspergillus pseudonomiae]